MITPRPALGLVDARPAPSPVGETPWLLFIGILMMALVPAIFSQQKVREFEGRLAGLEDHVGGDQMKLVQLTSYQTHHKQNLQKLDERLRHLATLVPRVDEAERKAKVAAELSDQLAEHLDTLEQRVPQMIEEADARIATLEQATKDVVSKKEVEVAFKELASRRGREKEELFKMLASNVKEMDKAIDKAVTQTHNHLQKQIGQLVDMVDGEKRTIVLKSDLKALVELVRGLKNQVATLQAKLAKLEQAAGGADDGAQARAELKKALDALAGQSAANAKAIEALKQAAEKGAEK